jgi:hypothetical protein
MGARQTWTCNTLLTRGDFRNFAEIISSMLTDTERVTEAPWTTPKHLGTDQLFPGTVYADLATHPESKLSKNRKKKIV